MSISLAFCSYLWYNIPQKFFQPLVRGSLLSTFTVTPESISQLYDKLAARDAGIQETYDSTLDALGLDRDNPVYTFYQEVKKRTKLWWEKTNTDRDQTVHVDVLHQIIEEQRTYLGAQRSVRAPMPPVELFDGDEDAAQEYADKLERLVIHLWREWGMARKYSLLAWYGAILGSGIGTLFWDKDSGLPYFKVHSPRGFHAQAKIGDDTRVAQAVFAYYVNGDSLAMQYPQAAHLAGSDRVLLLDYFDENVRMRIVYGENIVLISAKNDIAHCPVYIFPSILVPGLYGASRMPHVIPLQNEIDRLYSLEAESITEQVRAPLIITQGEKVPEGFTLGDDAVITVGAGGGVAKARLDAIDHNLVARRIADMRELVDEMMDFSPVSRGDFSGSVLTGKGVSALQRSPAARLEIRLQTMNEVMDRVMEDALLLMRKRGRASQVYGNAGGSSFSVWFDPKDINPKWCKVQCYVDSANFVDRQAAQVENLQKVRGTPRLMSRRRFLELDPDCEDVNAELKRIDAEDMALAEMQMAILQQSQNLQQGGQSAAQQNYAAERGAPVPGTPPSTPTAPPPTGPQGASPAPEQQAASPVPDQQATLAALADFFRNIPKIKGQVFLCGLSAEGDLSMGIDLYLTDPSDKQTILNAMHNDPELNQMFDQIRPGEDPIQFLPDMPNGQVLEVTPGTTGLTPQNTASQAQASPQGGLPPEMQQQMAVPGQLPGQYGTSRMRLTNPLT